MIFGVSITATVVVAIVGMVVGMTWYSPKFFGTEWARLVGLDISDPNMKKGMGALMLKGFISQLIMAHVLGFFVLAMTATSFADGAWVGVWAWLGFVATVTFGSVLWEKRPVKLFYINAAHSLLVLVLMGGIQALMN